MSEDPQAVLRDLLLGRILAASINGKEGKAEGRKRLAELVNAPPRAITCRA